MVSTLKALLLLIFGIPVMFMTYCFQGYSNSFKMFWNGVKVKRLKKSYYDSGNVVISAELNKAKRFENQILGALVFIPVTAVILTLLICMVLYLFRSV